MVRQGAFYGRYPSTPHTAGLLAYASQSRAFSLSQWHYCGSHDDYSDRIARDSHPIPYSPPPLDEGTAHGYLTFSIIVSAFRHVNRQKTRKTTFLPQFDL